MITFFTGFVKTAGGSTVAFGGTTIGLKLNQANGGTGDLFIINSAGSTPPWLVFGADGLLTLGPSIQFIAPAGLFVDILQNGMTADAVGGVYVGIASDPAQALVNSTWTFPSSVSTGTFTVATLPTGTLGARAFVSDGSTTIILGLGLTAIGGGANKVPVYYDGATWKVG